MYRYSKFNWETRSGWLILLTPKWNMFAMHLDDEDKDEDEKKK